MNEDSRRQVDLTRIGLGHYRATNARGATVEMGIGDDQRFSPVELLLAAVAGCGAADVDYITVKRSEPDSFEVRVRADKVRDEEGNHLTDVVLSFAVEFPDGEGGDLARESLPRAVRQSHERLCTVSRTVQLPTDVRVEVVGAVPERE